MKLFLRILISLFLVSGVYLCWRFSNRNYEKEMKRERHSSKSLEKKISIGTYNIKSLQKGTRLEAVVEEIKKVNLDVICLQEVDKNARRSNTIDMVKEIAKQAGYPYHYFYKTMWIISGYYGLGILSKYPISKVSSKELPNRIISEPRIIAGADINIDGNIIHFYNTHVSYVSEKIRNKEIAYIEALLKHQKNAVLLGDMNAVSKNGFFEIEGFLAVNNHETKLHTYKNAVYTDNIYYAKNFKIENVQVIDSSFSDHKLLLCTLVISNRK